MRPMVPMPCGNDCDEGASEGGGLHRKDQIETVPSYAHGASLALEPQSYSTCPLNRKGKKMHVRGSGMERRRRSATSWLP
jgi:hypothetical protein